MGGETLAAGTRILERCFTLRAILTAASKPSGILNTQTILNETEKDHFNSTWRVRGQH